MAMSDLIGLTVHSIDLRIGTADDEIVFHTREGRKFKMHHVPDCCEHVSIDDINGDMTDLLNTPIIKAYCGNSRNNPPGVVKEGQDSFTYTFYHFVTLYGAVTVRWYGESNGYYCETAEFDEIKK